MDAHEALMQRRTAHAWIPEGDLPEAVLHRALQAAHQAPCHRHTWPWRFLVLGPDTRDELAEIAIVVKERMKGELPEPQKNAIRGKFRDPSAMLAVTRVRSDDAFQAREDYAAVCCAIQNLQLSVTADGYAAKWGTGAATRDAATYSLLEVDPDVEEICGILYVGRARSYPTVVRPPLHDVVRRLP